MNLIFISSPCFAKHNGFLRSWIGLGLPHVEEGGGSGAKGDPHFYVHALAVTVASLPSARFSDTLTA
jgi:hypothetical protein